MYAKVNGGLPAIPAALGGLVGRGVGDVDELE